MAAVEVEDELETGASGTVSKVVRIRFVDRVDPAVEFEVDLAPAGGDDVGQSVGGGAQIDRTFQRLFKQRGFGLGEADHRGGRAGAAANWILVQGLLRWALSIWSGRQGDRVSAILAPPGLVVRVACRPGLPARLVDPATPSASLGVKGRTAQLKA